MVSTEPWLRARLEMISRKGKLAEDIRYALTRLEGLARFLDDGRIELDSSTVAGVVGLDNAAARPVLWFRIGVSYGPDPKSLTSVRHGLPIWGVSSSEVARNAGADLWDSL